MSDALELLHRDVRDVVLDDSVSWRSRCPQKCEMRLHVEFVKLVSAAEDATVDHCSRQAIHVLRVSVLLRCWVELRCMSLRCHLYKSAIARFSEVLLTHVLTTIENFGNLSGGPYSCGSMQASPISPNSSFSTI